MEPLPSPPSSTATSAASSGGVLRRRNGRQQACEPCRKRKVACDHSVPVCQRCKRRNASDRCVYLVPGGGHGRAQAASGVSASTATASTMANAAHPAIRGQEATPVPAAEPVMPLPARMIERGRSTPIIGMGDNSPESPETMRPNGVTSPGYLGFTSFSEVYQETRNSLSLVQGGGVDSAAPGMPLSPDTAAAMEPEDDVDNEDDDLLCSSAPALSPRTLELCLTVLRYVPGPDAADPLFAKHTNPNDGWLRLAARRLLRSLYDTFGHYLGPERDAVQLERMARLLVRNTLRPLHEDEPDPEAWLAGFSGRNMRWESLGILFTYWALGKSSLTTHRPDLAVRVPGSKPSWLSFKECAQLCIEICNGACGGKGNTLMLYLVYKHAILESVTTGDASLSMWRYHGEVCALVTFLGLHAIPNVDTYFPTASSEGRRRLFCQIFVIDKVVASFTGRPPLLSHRYASTPLPLDLGDESLLEGRESTERAMTTLDERGWGVQGKLYSTTILRARYQMATIRDMIFEIALGHQAASVEALHDLEARELETYAGFPPVLHFHQEDVRNTRGVDSGTLYTRVVIRVEHLQNVFFVRRLLTQRGHESHADLVSVSFEMVSLTLIFWTHMDRMAGLHGDFEWLVMAYAAPAGGILCLELLKSTFQRHPTNGEITRSSIIQQLSLLIGFLDWVSPSAPNGDLCNSCKVVIERVLDQTLNGGPTPGLVSGAGGVSTSSQGSTNDQTAAGVVGMDWDMFEGTNFAGYFNFELLDTFDWMRNDLVPSQQSG